MVDAKMAKKDFITSIVLIAFSMTIIAMSYTMPRLERRGIDPFSAPGVVPGMIGLVLLCLALILFIRSVKYGGFRITQETTGHAEEQNQKGAASRVLLTLFVSLAYAIGLLGRLNYSVSTALFIFAFICMFEIRPGLSLWNQRKTVLVALVQAVVASLLITVVFQNLFLVDLP